MQTNRQYSFVDNGITLSGHYHIRVVGPAGKKLSGGIDTIPFCGQYQRHWFDSQAPMNEANLEHACKDCVRLYREDVSKREKQ